MRTRRRGALLIAASILFALPAVSAEWPRAAPLAVRTSGSGPDLVFIPGLATDGAVWNATAGHLACFKSHVVSLAGFAGQPPIEPPLLGRWEAQIVGYIERQRLQQPTLIGHSLGGVLAMRIAIDHPGLIGRLIIVDALPFLPAGQYPGATVASITPTAASVREGILQQSPEAFRASQEQALARLTRTPAAREALLQWSLQSDRATIANAYYELVTTDLRQSLDHISAPVTVIFPSSAAQNVYAEQYRSLKGARLVAVEGTEHFVMYDQPQALYERITESLPTCEARR